MIYLLISIAGGAAMAAILGRQLASKRVPTWPELGCYTLATLLCTAFLVLGLRSSS